MQRIGIMAAVHGEIATLLQQMDSVTVTRIGMRDYHQGVLHGKPCVVVLARMGKVAAAATAVTLIREFGVDNVLFTGLAGGIAGCTRIGDIVVATSLLHHDLDASPLFARHEIPLLDLSRIHADPDLSNLLEQAACDYLAFDWTNDMSAATREMFNLSTPSVHTGLIASGDQFVSSASAAQALCNTLPDVLCVEMEGAAVAQVCHEYSAPFAVLRTVSDRADDTASHDFNSFLTQVASHYSAGILRRAISLL
ncbi:MAG: 5'-methylthioadenosine/adenosylhomocysteine nucleosidase [Alcaligenaceae bacterium]|nr:5'-methylthioadenosine/adenosylhomocysteine nucleosidase [Alcaligenaceae bacterium]